MSITTLFGTRLLSGLGALAIAGSVAGGTAIAGDPARTDDAKGKGRGKEVAEARHELKDRIEPEREAIAELRRQLADEYAKADPDEAELQRLHDAISAHRDAISDMRHEVLVDMHDELDAAQRAKVAERIAGKHEGKAKGKDKPKSKDEREAKSASKGKDKPKGKDKSKGKDKPEASDR
jgi:Spy/CpxP family protein refolding chaperone